MLGVSMATQYDAKTSFPRENMANHNETLHCIVWWLSFPLLVLAHVGQMPDAAAEELSSWEFGAGSKQAKQRRHSSTQEFSFGPSKDSTCDDVPDYEDNGDVDFDDVDGGHGESNEDKF